MMRRVQVESPFAPQTLARKLTVLEADAVSLRESDSSLSLLHSAELCQTRDEHRLACRARKLIEEIDRNRRAG